MPLTEVDDLELTSRARDGDERAVVELWTRHYPAALSTAHRVARQPRDAEELASDAFSGMLAALRKGGGPTGSVRAYLLTSVRNGVMTRGRRANASDILTDQISLLENAADVPTDPVAAASELGLMREAFASLPARWQLVLWRTAVDHEANISVAEELGVSPNAVAALARRARQGLRAAYVQAHVSRGAIDPECAPFIRGLVAMLTPSADTTPTAMHVRGCARCTERLAELRKVDQNLSGILGPAVLALLPTGVGAAVGAGPATGAGSAAGAGSTTGVAAGHGGVTASGSAHWVALATAVAVSGGLLTWALWPERPALEHMPVAVATSLSPATPVSSPAPPPPTQLPVTAATPSAPPTSSPPAPSTTKQASAVALPIVTAPTPAPTPSPAPTPTTQAPRGALWLAMAMGGPTSAPFIQVSASGQQLTGGLGLRVSVPAGVSLVRYSGAWRGCAQSGRDITCTAAASPSATGQSWSGTISTRWTARSTSSVSARATGTYRSGSAASATATTHWPSP